MSNPKCTNCGYEFDDDETWYSSYSQESEVNSGDCEISELKCHSCNEKFHVICVHTITWEQCDEDGDRL